MTYREWLRGTPRIIHSYLPIFTQRSTSLPVGTPRQVKYLNTTNVLIQCFNTDDEAMTDMPK